MKLTTLLSATCACVLSTSLMANTLLIRGADLYTPDGVKSATDLLIKDGKIAAIGKGLVAPKGSPEIDGRGKSVTPGLFNADTHLGVEEISAIDQTADFASDHKDFTAAMKVADGFNPDSIVIAHNRAQGLTHALVVPDSRAGIFAGQAALINLSVGDDKILNDSVAVVVSLGETGQALAGGSRSVALALLRQALDDAKDLVDNRAAVNKGARRDYGLSLADIESLVPVIKKDKALLVEVQRADDIRRVLTLAKAYSINVILSGVIEGWRVADAIAAAKVPVILDPINNLPYSYEQLGARLDNAAQLEQAGVTLLLTGMGWQNTHNAYLVRQSAGNAVANGLSKTAAINAMSLNPATVFGLKNTGGLVVGYRASLVVWSGDPLEVITNPELVLIEGKNIPLVSRASRLRDRYYERLSAGMRK